VDLILTDLAVGPMVFFAALTVLAKLIEEWPRPVSVVLLD